MALQGNFPDLWSAQPRVGVGLAVPLLHCRVPVFETWACRGISVLQFAAAHSSVAWSDPGGSGVTLILISLGSFRSSGSRAEPGTGRGTELQEWGWSGCCSHRKEEGSRTQETASVSVLPSIPCEDRVLSHLRERTAGSAVTFGVFFHVAVSSFPPVPIALHSLQLAAAPCWAVQRAGMSRLCFLCCLFVFPSLADPPGRRLIEFFYVKMDFFSLRRIIEPVSSQVANCPRVPEAEDEGQGCPVPGAGRGPGCPALAPRPCGMAAARPRARGQHRQLRSWSAWQRWHRARHGHGQPGGAQGQGQGRPGI